MVELYFDIETYSPGEELHFTKDLKIIAIGYKEKNGVLRLFGEWKSDEKTILSPFYFYLKKMVTHEKFVMILGFNLFGFDRPLLETRLLFHKIDTLENILETFRKILWVDLLQCLLPLQRFNPKGLSQKNIAQRLKLKDSEHPGKEIPKLYAAKEYGTIVKHLQDDLQFIEELHNWFTNHEGLKKCKLDLY